MDVQYAATHGNGPKWDMYNFTPQEVRRITSHANGDDHVIPGIYTDPKIVKAAHEELKR